MLKNAYAMIMAGGRGERFWPLSTSRRPKQLLRLVGSKPMIVAAVDRLKGVVPEDHIFIITNADLVHATADVIPSLPRENIVGEPFGRDTAAAVALGMVLVRHRDLKAAFCVLTADHVIGDVALFRKTLIEGLKRAAAEDVLVTIGIKPAFPSTGFGYIETGRKLAETRGIEFREAKRFVEKPDFRTAKKYLRTGRFFWNSGMFIWSVRSIENAFRQHRPPLFEMARRLARDAGTRAFFPAVRREYRKLERISIDYAVMEKSRNIVMAKGIFAWDDVGSWPALENHLDRDAAGNVVIGACEALDSSGNVVVSNERLTALIGVRDMVVVQAGGATLVCPKDRAQEVKKLVKQLRQRDSYQHLL